MKKLKEALAGVWYYIVLVLGAILGVVLYVLNLRSKELDAAKAKIALADTQKQADALESEIKGKMEQQDLNKKEMAGLEKALDLLTEKRKNIKKEGNLNDEAVEDYWSGKKKT